ncbi:BBP7 family outer membrane beta-barrel protein [Zavarzinella formosa]|uniref:BBP7 family outer membrane beta-barrel protein n=1 Tax=Zavarzinella formosa TaxID=360055 RepID=UPI0004950B0C|nr:BBP7 family outer membrane beta-barrel protein [Zavarzinella formosa]
MKRTLFGLGGSLAFIAMPAFAQDSVPAASLGRPAASLGRPVADYAPGITSPSLDVRPVAAIDFVPKAMPKGTVNETTPILPMPGGTGPMVPMPGSIGSSTPMPVVTSPSMPGPAFVTPGTPIPMNGPIPGVPVMVQPPGGGMPGPEMGMPGPVIASPMPGGCDSPYGCGIPGLAGVGGMPVPMSRWYTSGEYLLWWMKGYIAPPLATVGPVASEGILGRPGVTTIYPTDRITNNPISGFRMGLGYWFSPKWAIESNFFFLRDSGSTFSASSNQYPNSILARPFFSLNQNAEFVEQIGNPGIYAGYINVLHRSTLWGLDLNLRKHLYQSCTSSFDLLGGFRMVDLGEELTIQESATGLAGAPRQFIGQSRLLTDSFKTKNQFYGGQIGAVFNQQWGRWSLNTQAKIALGGSVMTSSVSGGIAGGVSPPPNQPGGLLALNSNIGSVTATKLAYVPEVNLNLGYDITQHTKIFVGYSFLYWSSVARPGAQIDRSLNEYSIPDFTIGRSPPQTTDPRPLNVVQRESFWAQGFNVGLQFRW